MTTDFGRLLSDRAVLAAGLVLLLFHIPIPGVSDPGSGVAAPPLAPPLAEGSAEGEYAQGVMALHHGRLQEAHGHLDRAIALDPACAVAYAQKALAHALGQAEEAGEARRLLNEAVRRGFDRDAALRRIRKLALGESDPKEAGRRHLECAMLLAFGSPPDPAGAEKALAEAKACGATLPAGLKSVGGPDDIPTKDP